MLPAPHRLRSRSDHEAVRAGRRASAGALSVQVLLTDADQPARLGFTVGRRIGGAVERNRLRRRLREAARELVAELPRGALVLVRVRPEAAELGLDRLRALLTDALRTATLPARPRGAAG